jgi:aryl-alcohol dehydrogenase-like predicted oxidoreductase
MRTDHQVNFFDNAEGYGAGDAETLMGEAIQLGIERDVWDREDLVISTKIFNGTTAKWRDTAMGMNKVGLSRKHLYEGLRASLKRMQLEYVDLVFCHRPDPATPMEEVVRSFNEMINLRMCFCEASHPTPATHASSLSHTYVVLLSSLSSGSTLP